MPMVCSKLWRGVSPIPLVPRARVSRSSPSLEGRSCWSGLSHRTQFFELVFEDRSDFVEAFLIARLVASHQRGLGVGGAHQAPSIGELHARAIDRDDVVVFREIFGGIFDHP